MNSMALASAFCVRGSHVLLDMRNAAERQLASDARGVEEAQAESRQAEVKASAKVAAQPSELADELAKLKLEHRSRARAT